MTIDDFVKIGALRSGMRQYAEKRDRHEKGVRYLAVANPSV